MKKGVSNFYVLHKNDHIKLLHDLSNYVVMCLFAD